MYCAEMESAEMAPSSCVFFHRSQVKLASLRANTYLLISPNWCGWKLISSPMMRQQTYTYFLNRGASLINGSHTFECKHGKI